MPKAAEALLGVTLDGGWNVVAKVPKQPGSSGGFFSVGYLVEDPTGKKGFLKALDLSSAFMHQDPARMLQSLTESYNFERDLLKMCRGMHMDRIATAFADGTYRYPPGGPQEPVPYLIFEQADGDIRSQIDLSHRLDLPIRFRLLHHVATGLWQLHKQEIAHQDLKPSNVLLFDKKESKLADLGRAARRGQNPPHEGCIIQGDCGYAPPELLYGAPGETWFARRQGCDLYLLGSLVVYFFAGSAMTPEIMRGIPPTHHPSTWKGSYQEVMPHVGKAFGEALSRIRQNLGPEFREELMEIITHLCEPDITRRGHPKGRGSQAQQYSVERYVTIFDRMASRAILTIPRKACPL